MHLHKPIEKITELKDFFTRDEKAAKVLDDFTATLTNRYITRQLFEVKQKGHAAVSLICLMLLFPLLNIANIRQLLHSRAAFLSDSGKDAYYRLKNNELINWRKLLLQVAKSYKAILLKHGKWPGQFNGCLIIDDTVIEKRGRHIEGVSMVHNHCQHRQVLGFKLLLIGYWDGHCFIPLDFSLHRAKGGNQKKPHGLTKTQNKEQYKKYRESTSPGFQRKKELDTSRVDQALKLIRRVVKHGFVGSYVLFDSWFFSEKLLKGIKRLKNGGMEIIAMAKQNIGKFEYQGCQYTSGELRQKLKGHKKRCKYLRATYIECEATYKGIPVKLFMVRYHRKSKWRVMITTDLELSFLQLMKNYSHRWCIEVFFKEAKQYLHLGKSHSQAFDAQVADATMAMMRYIVLTLHKRFHHYESIGELFSQAREATLILTIADRIWGLILEVVNQLCQLLEIDDPDTITGKMIAETATNTEQDKLINILRAAQQHSPTQKNVA